MAEEEEESTSGDSTDVCSVHFDSLKALYSDEVRLPVPQAPLFDNLSKFESVLLKGLESKPLNEKDRRGQEEQKHSLRRFLPHQEPINSKNLQREQRYDEKNVISRMQKSLGPLATLYDYMERKIRVKVYTRGASGLRGYVEAYITAFDRHWNLALEDCNEVWDRKVKKKVAALGGEPGAKRASAKLIVKRKSDKLETVERHVAQLLLRGEHVALIARLD